MPFYEYECQGCKKVFTLVRSLREHDTQAAACPQCGSKEIRQLMTSFTAKTDSKT